MAVNKICISKKLIIVVSFSAVLLLVYYFSSNYLLSIKKVLNNRAEAPENNLLIIGGEDVTPSDGFGSVAAITKGGIPMCTGTLIAPQWVVTAAHCVDPSPDSSTYIAVNILNKNEIYDSTNITQGFEVFQHPDYKPESSGGSGDNDIALILLEKEPKNVGKIVIPNLAQSADTYKSDDLATVVGWGCTEVLPSGFKTEDTLKKVKLPVLSDPARTNEFKVGYGNLFFDNRALEKSTCHGDSGGPVFKREGDKLYLLGEIVRSCHGLKKCPSDAVKISDVAKWMTDTMQKNPNPILPDCSRLNNYVCINTKGCKWHTCGDETFSGCYKRGAMSYFFCQEIPGIK